MLTVNLKTDSQFADTKFNTYQQTNLDSLHHVQAADPTNSADIGWLTVTEWADSMEQEHLKELAAKVQAYADVLVIIGVGGANQAARAVIEAFGQKHDQVQIIYAGTNLSPDYLSALTRGSSG
ncbi:hypothetical protein [Loigolactobacillus coryniformis]|uniref:hypothetical protein n=1 Tax=Loigolactobacillus coryniformis TaxID=1610 RepID=UPI0002ED6E97|nr:hypothetical protein [Loigolactobacillus coryniformis]